MSVWPKDDDLPIFHIHEIIIYYILPCASNICLLSISISLKGKGDNYKGRALQWKGRFQEQQHQLSKMLKLICGCKYSNLFHLEYTRHKIIIANSLYLPQDIQWIPLCVSKEKVHLTKSFKYLMHIFRASTFYILNMLRLTFSISDLIQSQVWE
jgi:hypothetical protein